VHQTNRLSDCLVADWG